MTWRDDLETVTIDGKKTIGASFRGVPFLVEAAERGGGRRVVVHEFPFRNLPFVEDLGAKAVTFRIDGYVVGDDYLTKRDALLTALEEVTGPGELVHPYHGVCYAICVGVSVRESKTDGGMATFAIEFAETPTQAPAPVVVVDSAARVEAGADAAIAATAAELHEKFDPAGLPAFALSSAEVALSRAAEALESVLAPVAATSQELADLTGRVALLTARASSLVRAPADLVAEVRAVVAGLIDTVAAAPGAVLEALLEAYGVDLGPPATGVTATRVREAENQAALSNALRRVTAVEAARLAPLVTFTSIEDAAAARDRIAAALEEQAALAGDTAYPALVNLRSEVLRAVPGERAFARVVTVTRPVAVPSLLLAYQLYGSVENEADILARNAVRHPGFVAGDLKVLSDA